MIRKSVQRFSEKIMRKTCSLKRPGGDLPPGLHVRLRAHLLEEAQHDCADKGESNVGGNHAQSADPSDWRSSWSHRNAPFTVRRADGVPTCINHQDSGALAREKVSAAVRALRRIWSAWLKTREIKALKSL
jgi:hypothetical protein